MPRLLRISVALLAMSGACCGGCAALAVAAVAGAAAGTYVYVNGEYKQSEDVSLDTAWEATQAAVKDLEFRVKETGKDTLKAHLQAEQSDDTNVWISLNRISDTSTQFTIRVGVMGSENQSRFIMDKIKSHF